MAGYIYIYKYILFVYIYTINIYIYIYTIDRFLLPNFFRYDQLRLANSVMVRYDLRILL